MQLIVQGLPSFDSQSLAQCFTGLLSLGFKNQLLKSVHWQQLSLYFTFNKRQVSSQRQGNNYAQQWFTDNISVHVFKDTPPLFGISIGLYEPSKALIQIIFFFMGKLLQGSMCRKKGLKQKNIKKLN